MDADRLRWLYFRLRAMPPGEWAHRLVEFGRRTVDRRRLFDFRGPHIDLPRIDGLRERVGRAPPDAQAAFRETAQNLREGRYRFLGQTWPKMEGVPLWHLDPVSRNLWPADRFCFSIPFRHARDYGDVKYVWEINRLQHLQYVAAASACDDDGELADICVSQIRSWIAANPPFRGVNWVSGIELALRAISLIIVVSLLPKTAFSGVDRAAISETLRAHLYWLARYPSRFSSANNHLVAEASALFILGVLAPDLPGAEEAASRGRRVLDAEALRQILPDGAPAEQSPTYGAFTVELMLVAHSIALAAGAQGLEQSTLDRFDAFAAFLDSITDSNGNVPRIGDDDEGRVIAGEGDHNEYLASVSSSIAARSEAKNPPAAPNAKEALRSVVLPSRTPAPTRRSAGVRCFRDGGYTVLRDAAEGDECLLVFDHGYLGYLGIAAHGHADALSIWLHVAGAPVLVDAGTYLYHAGADWRRCVRSTAAHNTLVVAGADQSLQAGAFNWATKANAKLVSLDDDPQRFRVVAEHDGYQKRFGVTHRRSIRRGGAGRYLVEDVLIGDSARSVDAEIGYLVAPGLTVEQDDHGWRIACAQRLLLAIECPDAGKRFTQRGLVEPVKSGWHSSRFGLREPAMRLVAAFAAGSQTLTTTIAVKPR